MWTQQNRHTGGKLWSDQNTSKYHLHHLHIPAFSSQALRSLPKSAVYTGKKNQLEAGTADDANVSEGCKIACLLCKNWTRHKLWYQNTTDTTIYLQSRQLEAAPYQWSGTTKLKRNSMFIYITKEKRTERLLCTIYVGNRVFLRPPENPPIQRYHWLDDRLDPDFQPAPIDKAAWPNYPGNPKFSRSRCPRRESTKKPIKSVYLSVLSGLMVTDERNSCTINHPKLSETSQESRFPAEKGEKHITWQMKTSRIAGRETRRSRIPIPESAGRRGEEKMATRVR